MSVTITELVEHSSFSWRVTWSSTLSDPTYYIYLEGSLFAVTQAETMLIPVSTSSAPLIEILDSATEIPESAFPGRISLHWFAPDNVDYFSIEELNGSWAEVGRVYASDLPYYTWESPLLDDCTEHTYRVKPIGTNGNEGAPKQFTVLMVRHPTEPDISMSYSSGTAVVTISAA